MISLLWPFFYSCIYCLFSCLFLREYFGNQASLTNCSGTLIRLSDSTASAPPVRRNKGSFQRVSFPIIHMSRVILSFNFPWYFPEKSGNICLFFRHVSFNIQRILSLFYLFIKLSFWTIQFVFVYLFVSYIRLFIRI